MASVSKAGLCSVMIMSAMSAMPWFTDGAHVRGGTVKPCDTFEIGEMECIPKEGKTDDACEPDKAQCEGCPGTASETWEMEILCKSQTAASCNEDPDDCKQNQNEGAEDEEEICITQACD